MRVARRGDAERAQDQQLLRRVREVIVSADDVGDPHVRVVDRDREVVQRGAVAAGDDEVVLAAVLEPHRPADQVVDHGDALVGHSQADRRAGLVAGLAAVSGAAVRLLPGADVVGGCRVGVGVAGVDKLRDAFRVALAARVLAHRALVPVELQPAQRVEDLLDVLRHRALAVGVLDAQHEAPRPSAWRGASCRAPCGRRRCAARPSAKGRSEDEVAKRCPC